MSTGQTRRNRIYLAATKSEQDNAAHIMEETEVSPIIRRPKPCKLSARGSILEVANTQTSNASLHGWSENFEGIQSSHATMDNNQAQQIPESSNCGLQPHAIDALSGQLRIRSDLAICSSPELDQRTLKDPRSSFCNLRAGPEPMSWR